MYVTVKQRACHVIIYMSHANTALLAWLDGPKVFLFIQPIFLNLALVSLWCAYCLLLCDEFAYLHCFNTSLILTHQLVDYKMLAAIGQIPVSTISLLVAWTSESRVRHHTVVQEQPSWAKTMSKQKSIYKKFNYFVLVKICGKQNVWHVKLALLRIVCLTLQLSGPCLLVLTILKWSPCSHYPR